MPYVTCPECGNRGYVLTPWSAAGRCPTCDAPLSVPRQSMAGRAGQRADFSQPAATPVDSGAAPASAAFRRHDEASAAFAKPLPEPATRPRSSVFQAGTLGALRQLVLRSAHAAGCSQQVADDLVLAVNEVATNSVVHGGGGGILRIWPEGDALVCEVGDRGFIEDPLVGQERPQLSQDDGWGLWLAHELCDLVQVRGSASGTVVRLHMRRA